MLRVSHVRVVVFSGGSAWHSLSQPKMLRTIGGRLPCQVKRPSSFDVLVQPRASSPASASAHSCARVLRPLAGNNRGVRPAAGSGGAPSRRAAPSRVENSTIIACSSDDAPHMMRA